MAERLDETMVLADAAPSGASEATGQAPAAGVLLDRSTEQGR